MLQPFFDDSTVQGFVFIFAFYRFATKAHCQKHAPFRSCIQNPSAPRARTIGITGMTDMIRTYRFQTCFLPWGNAVDPIVEKQDKASKWQQNEESRFFFLVHDCPGKRLSKQYRRLEIPRSTRSYCNASQASTATWGGITIQPCIQ